MASFANRAGAEANSGIKTILALAVDSRIPMLRRNIVRRLTNEIDQPFNHVDKIVGLLDDSTDPDHARDVVEAMSAALDGWSRVDLPDKWAQVAEKLVVHKDPKIDEAVLQLNVVFGDGRTNQELQKLVGNKQVDLETRSKGILTLAKTMESEKVFKFLKPHLKNRELANAAARALVYSDDEKAGEFLLGRFPTLDPAGRVIAVNTLSTRPAWASSLLDKIAQGKIEKSSLTAAHSRQIMNMGEQELTQKLIDVWGEVRQTSAEREKDCLLYTSPSPRDQRGSRMPSSA